MAMLVPWGAFHTSQRIAFGRFQNQLPNGTASNSCFQTHQKKGNMQKKHPHVSAYVNISYLGHH